MKAETLHQCNLDEISTFVECKALLGANDGLLFYANNFDSGKQKDLIREFDGVKTYFVYLDRPETYSIWVDMVNVYKRTMAWK